MKKLSNLQKKKNEEKARLKKEMFEMFLKIWDEREDENGNCYCFETGQVLPGYKYRGLSTVYHHVLEKSIYPEHTLNPENIVIISPDVHQEVHRSIEFTKKIKAYREKLLSCIGKE